MEESQPSQVTRVAPAVFEMNCFVDGNHQSARARLVLRAFSSYLRLKVELSALTVMESEPS